MNKATFRFEKGDSNILEKITAENQRGQAHLQLKQVEQDLELMYIQFQLLLNTTNVFIPEETGILKNNFSNDTTLLALHPSIQYWKQQQQIAKSITKLEQSKLAPDLTFGYSIMGMRGVGANNKEYNNLLQFQSGQIGLGIPIFTRSQRAKINASKINELKAIKEYELNLQHFENAYHTAFSLYKKFEEMVFYYENTALKNMKILITTANQQFLNGDINYLEWVLLLNQATSIQNDYIEALKNRNNAIVELNFYINKF